MFDNMKCLSENIRRNRDYLEKEAKSILKDHSFTVDVLEEVGEEKLEEMEEENGTEQDR